MTISGTGSSASASWDGKDSTGNYVPPGNYTATLTSTNCNGSCTASKSASVQVDCDLTLGDPVASPAEFSPYAGGSTTIGASVTTVMPYTWTVSVGGKTVTGPGPFKGFVWDGTGSSGFIVDPNVYQATVSVQTANGCGVSKNVDVKVLPPPDTCDLRKKADSSVNLASGNLTHDQALFSTRGGGTGTSVTLYYNSLDSHAIPLGRGWSHSYDIFLVQNSNGSMALQEGSGGKKLYDLAGGVYVSQARDYSTLIKNADGTFTLTQVDGTKQNFGMDGKIVSIVDRNGVTMTFAYTGGNLSGVTDGAARTTTFSYDGNNRLTSTTDPNGNAFTLTFTGDNLTAVTHPDNGSWSYTYDDSGFLLTKTDPNGNMVTYTYDDNHRLIRSIDPEGKTHDLDIPAASADTVKSTIFKEIDGGEWRYTYDTRTGRLTGQTDPLGNITTYTNDAIGNRTSVTDPSGATTSYTYYGQGNVLTTTDPLGNVTSYTYNSLGQVLTSSGPQGNTTNTYDASGNLLTATDPAGATTTYEYDTQGNVTKITNARNQVTTMAYNAAGLLASTTDPTGAVTSFTYDANGNTLTQTDPAGKVTNFVYDGMNRQTKVTDPLGNVTTYGYDKLENRTSVTDANSATTTFKYNYQGQMTEAKDALNNITTYSYGTTGGSGCTSCGGGVDKLISLTDAKGQTTGYQYDLLGRLTQETDPLAKATAYTYDAVGNLVTKTDANGAATTYAYDALKRLTQKTYPNTTTESYTYDTAGRISTTANNNITYTYAYDADSRVTSVTDSRGNAINYQYDALGNRTQMTLLPTTADQRIVNYSFDNGNRLQTITSPAGTFTYGYDTAGRRTSLAYPNQITASYAYDDAGRLTSLTHISGGSTIAAFTYTLDKVGNRLSKSGTSNETYGYDVIYRLLQALKVKGTEKYTHDAVGNRLTGPGPKDISYLYNADNQMTKGRQFSYVYDNNGNQITRTVPNAADRTWTQTWDYENRLTKLEKIKGVEKRTITFAYDPQGRRIGKQLTTVIGGVTTTYTWSYVYDNDNIVLEVYTDNTGAVTKTWYTQGPGIDEHLALERSGSFYFYHADGLGSIVAITDSAHSVVQSYTYDSFGMVTAANNTFRNSFTYTGREWDKETGLYYHRARYRDPMDGNFINKDPIGFKGGINVYAYALNNVINNTDPDGKAVQLCQRALGDFPFRLGPFNHTYLYVNGQRIGLHPGGVDPNEKKGNDISCGSPLKCVDDSCVLQKAMMVPPTYYFGFYDCRAWAETIILLCHKKNCCEGN